MRKVLLLIVGFSFIACSHIPKHDSKIAGIPTTRQPACGDPSHEPKLEVGGDVELAKSFRGKSLVCKVGEDLVEGRVSEFAKYRCPGSPTYLRLETFGQSRKVYMVQAKDDGANVISTHTLTSPLFPMDEGTTSDLPEHTFCKVEDPKEGVLLIRDFSCQKDVVRAIWSSLIQSYHKHRAELKLPAEPGLIRFELQKGEKKGSYTASNITIDGKAINGASASATTTPTAEGCKASATGSIK